jgi:hypothetical protein
LANGLNGNLGLRQVISALGSGVVKGLTDNALQGLVHADMRART